MTPKDEESQEKMGYHSFFRIEVEALSMESSVQCYMVRAIVVPDFLGRSFLETYFIAESDLNAVEDSFRYAQALVLTYSLQVVKLEVFDCHLSKMVEGVNQGGTDRVIYDSENLYDSIIQERSDFIGG